MPYKLIIVACSAWPQPLATEPVQTHCAAVIVKLYVCMHIQNAENFVEYKVHEFKPLPFRKSEL